MARRNWVIPLILTIYAILPLIPGAFRLVELGGGAYVSLWKNSGEGEDEHDFRTGHTYMLTFDPMIGFKTKLGEHGVGITLNYVLGNESYIDSLGNEHDFDNFGNWGVKLRPVVLRWNRLIWEWNIRLYPNGFDVVEAPLPAVVTVSAVMLATRKVTSVPSGAISSPARTIMPLMFANGLPDMMMLLIAKREAASSMSFCRCARARAGTT